MDPPGKPMWSTHDPACSHCRVRKIRCGRERPRCTNCQRDNVSCDFSDTGKRVNHMKLLVNNFGELEERLTTIEKGVNQLIELSQIQQQSPPPEVPLGRSRLSAELNKHPQTDDRYTIQIQDDGIEHYHGPCSLESLCCDFRSFMQGHTEVDNNNSGGIYTNQQILDQISAPTSTPLHFQESETATTLLPPKPFLLMSCPLFFQQQDTIVDIFNQALFWKNVHRVYSRPLAQTDSPWALCFTVIILLVLGQDQHILMTSDPVMRSQLVGPLITSIRRSSTSIKLLMAPKLINIQALILLSIAAEQHLEPGTSEVLLGHACTLAKRMGLHQRLKSSGDGTPADCEERLKVFRSLFLREKSLCISHSANCWLPSAHCSMYLDLGKQLSASKMGAMRLHLALLQEETSTILNSTRCPDLDSHGKATIKRLEQAFEEWLNEYAELNDPESTVSIDLVMDLYACRLAALQHSSDPKHKNKLLSDARAICRLLCTKMKLLEKKAISDLQALVNPSVDSRDPVEIVSTQETDGITDQGANPFFPLRSLTESFSCIGYFTMVKGILSTDSEETCRDDLHLLQSVCQIFKKNELNTLEENYTQKVLRTFQALLAIVYNVKPELFQDQHPEFPEDNFLNGLVDQSDNPTTSHSSSKTTISEPPSPNSGFAKLNAQQYQTGFFDVESLSASMRQSPFDLDMLESFDFDGKVQFQDSTITQIATPLSKESGNKRPRLSTSQATVLPHTFSFPADLNSPLMTEMQNAIHMW